MDARTYDDDDDDGRATSSYSRLIRYEKWRLILSMIVFLLVVLWLVLLPGVLVLLLYGFFHRRIKFFIQFVISFFTKYTQQRDHRIIMLNGCSQAVALHFARKLNANGHRVIGCDYPINWLNATRFSQSVDEYYTVPNPRRGVQEYIRALCLIAQKENVDVFIPISRLEDLNFDLLTKLPLERQGCRVLSLHPWKQTLDNRDPMATSNYIMRASNNNNDNDQVEINNAINSSNQRNGERNNRQPVRRSSVIERMPLKQSFEVICEKVTDMSALMFWGTKCSSTCLIRSGRTIAVSTCPYDPTASVDNWDEINQKVINWTEQIMHEVAPEHRSGALSFDLLISLEGVIIPHACRPHVGMASLNFSSQADLVNCWIQPQVSLPEKPYQTVGGIQSYCFYPEIWDVMKHPNVTKMKAFAHRVWHSKEAFFDLADPLPFFIHYHLHLPFVVAFEVMRGKIWTEIDFLNGKLLGC